MSAEEGRADALGNRLSVLNRVLRHDIRTNVTIIRGNAQQIVDEEVPPKEAARVIRRQAVDLYHMSEEARRLETVIAEDDPVLETVDVARVAGERARELDREFPDATVVTDLPERAVARVSPMIDAAIENIIRNDIEHDPGDPHVEVGCRVREDAVELTVRDRGPGIPAPELRVLERGAETDLEHASGLGLWLTNWVVAASDGAIEFGDGDDGTEITIRLPRGQPPYTSASSARSDPTTR